MSSHIMQQYYGSRAGEYDRVYKKPERQQDLREIERWLPSVFGGMSILEIACGTGYWTQFLAPAAKEIVAVDASVETLSIAKARVSLDSVQFVQGDAYHLPVGPGKFEAGFAGFWLSHVPRAQVGSFLRGLHQALLPGAKVVLLDNLFVDGSSTPIDEHDDEGNSFQVRRLEDGSTYKVLKNFPSESELRRVVEGSANDVRYREWQYFWALEYVVATP